MNCPNCNEPLDPTRETRTTTGVSRHYRCPCGLSFNAYRPAYGDEWTVSLVTTVARPKRKPGDANRARRSMLKMAWEDMQLLGRFGVETEQARQKVISAKENGDEQGLVSRESKTNRPPDDRQRRWAAGGLNRRPSRGPGGNKGSVRTNGAR